MKKFKLFGQIMKSEPQDDGTLIVSGIASAEVQDSQGETVAAEAMKAAIPDYMQFGCVREMHSAEKAAGTAISIHTDDNGVTKFECHVVDPVAVLKCNTGVYKGFSIGGRVTKRDDLNKSRITGLRLTEISLVDRPANPEARFECFKADNDNDADDAEMDAGAEGQAPGVVEAPAPDVPDIEPAVVEAPAAEPAAEVIAQAEPAAAIVVEAPIFKMNVDGTEVSLRKNADGNFEVVPSVLEKGCYNISRLAELCSSLEYFASSLQWDADDGSAPATIPQAIRDMASKLYDQLVLLVGAEVDAAKQRIKDAKKADAPDDLQKSALAKAEDRVGELFEEIGKALNIDFAKGGDLSDFATSLLKSHQGLSADLVLAKAELTKIKAMPSNAGPVLRIVGRDGTATPVAKSDANPDDGVAPTTPLDAMKKTHQAGGIIQPR